MAIVFGFENQTFLAKSDIGTLNYTEDGRGGQEIFLKNFFFYCFSKDK